MVCEPRPGCLMDSAITRVDIVWYFGMEQGWPRKFTEAPITTAGNRQATISVLESPTVNINTFFNSLSSDSFCFVEGLK